MSKMLHQAAHSVSVLSVTIACVNTIYSFVSLIAHCPYRSRLHLLPDAKIEIPSCHLHNIQRRGLQHPQSVAFGCVVFG